MRSCGASLQRWAGQIRLNRASLSINLRCATPLLPIVIDRPSPPLHRPLPNEAINAPQQQTASAEIPIASDAPLRHISRGFLPCRFADAGPAARGAVIMGRHPKTFTDGDIVTIIRLSCVKQTLAGVGQRIRCFQRR